MKRRLYWMGNAAKTRVINELLGLCDYNKHAAIILDYGCGDGGDWPSILCDNPQLQLIAYEPYHRIREKARVRLEPHGARVLTSSEFVNLETRADYIVSFSVFEHVRHREQFLVHAKRILAAGGLFFLNYDDGHFRNYLDLADPRTWRIALRECIRTKLSGPLALLGDYSRYQARVESRETDVLVERAGFRIERAEYHNIPCLKHLYKTIPACLQQHYMALWLEFEISLNRTFKLHSEDPGSGDSINLWQQMTSRTLLLRHS